MADWNLTDWKNDGLEFGGLENDGLELADWKNDGLELTDWKKTDCKLLKYMDGHWLRHVH